MIENSIVNTLEETVEEKDMGVWIDDELKFVKHIEIAASKGNQRPELCTSPDCRVSSRVPSHACRVSSHCFFQGLSPESSRASSVSSPESSRVIAKVSRVIIAQLVVSSN